MAVSKATVMNALQNFKRLQDAQNAKAFVAQEEGKGLSQNDFTDEDKAKLDELEVYKLPTASRWQKGGVQIIDGSGLAMSGDFLMVTIQGSESGTDYTLPTASATEKGGIKIGDGLEMQGDTLNCTISSGTLDLVTQTENGLMRATDKVKLDNIENNAQENVIESIWVDNTPQLIEDKIAKLDLTSFAKKNQVASGVRMKGSVDSYTDLPTNAEVGDLYNVKTAGGLDGDGTPIEAGDNVVFTDKGTWDVMAGFIDLSDFAKLTDLTGALSSINSLSVAINKLSNASLKPATTTDLGGIIVGKGLEVKNDGTLNCTVKGKTYSEFEGATSITGGQSGLVPQPKAGDNKKFLCGDGTWANASELVHVVIGGGGSATAMSSGVSTIQGGLWQDFIDGVPVLKLRYGDYEYNFYHDTSNRNGDGTTPLDTTTKGVEYILTTVPSSEDGQLWYVVKDGVPNLAMHKWAFDYFFNYDTITYKGSYANLFSYLPFDSTTADALGHLWTLDGTPTIEISPAGVKALKSTGSLTSPATVTDAFKAIQGMDWTLDFWLTIENVASYKSNTNAYNLLTVSCKANSLYVSNFPNNRFFIQEGKLYRTDGGTGIKKEACGDTLLVGQRTHFALSGNGNLFINGKLVGTDFNTAVGVASSNGAKSRGTMTAITKFVLFGSYSTSYPMYIDHFRIFKNQIVWPSDFDPPSLEAYLK